MDDLTILPARQVMAAPQTDSSMLMAIIERASTAPEFDLGRLEKLLELKERWDAGAARKAFTVAMAAFKADPPKIYKNKHVDQGTGKAKYDHATHSEVTMKVIAALAAHGMSHRWNIQVTAQSFVEVTCIITHALGHSEQVTMGAPPDSTGSKSAVQAIASTSTLLQRYTLLAATGLSAADLPDADDKRTGGPAEVPEVPVDVWTTLNEASREGVQPLGNAFKGLTEQTRAIIVLHYGAEWAALKKTSAAVKVKT
jgi:hypothetical protein